MTPGSYYVYGVTNDCTNPDVTDYSPGQITINAAANNPPTLTVDEPDGTGDTVTVSSVPLGSLTVKVGELLPAALIVICPGE